MPGFFVSNCLKPPRQGVTYVDLGSIWAGPQSRQSAKLFLQSSEMGHPQPPTRRRVCPPPFGSGGAHSLAGEGLGESQFRRVTYTVVFCIFKYFVGWLANTTSYMIDKLEIKRQNAGLSLAVY
jgi:hypothetical protein